MGKLIFYYVDMKYICDLANADSNVLSVSPQDNKQTRPFVWVILVCGSRTYCVPLSSPKKKHETMKNREDFSRIVDNNGRIIGVLNFNNMIPVCQEIITPIDIRPNRSAPLLRSDGKKLWTFSLTGAIKIELICKKANKLYHLVTETPEKMRSLTRRCCDFKKLETILDKRLENITVKWYYKHLLIWYNNIIGGIFMSKHIDKSILREYNIIYSFLYNTMGEVNNRIELTAS